MKKWVVALLIGTPALAAPPQPAAPVARSCYLNHFEPGAFPWPEDACLNYEEVFKNIEYWETSLNWLERRLIVKRFSKGKEVESKAYTVATDGKLVPAK